MCPDNTEQMLIWSLLGRTRIKSQLLVSERCHISVGSSVVAAFAGITIIVFNVLLSFSLEYSGRETETQRAERDTETAHEQRA